MRKFAGLLFFILVYPGKTVGSTCYDDKLTYNSNECLNGLEDDGILAKVIAGQICKEVACTRFIPSIKANVCIIKEKNSFNFVIYGNGTSSTYRFDTFESDYNVARIAVREDWITMLQEYNGTEAYRLSFILNKLTKIKSNNRKPEYMGKLQNIVWEPSLQDDKYQILIGTEVRERHWCLPGALCSQNERKFIDLPHDRCIVVNEIPTPPTESCMEKHNKAQILLLWSLICNGFLILALIIAIFVIVRLFKRNSKKSFKSDISLKHPSSKDPLHSQQNQEESEAPSMPSPDIKHVGINQDILHPLKSRQQNIHGSLFHPVHSNHTYRFQHQGLAPLSTISEEDSSATQSKTPQANAPTSPSAPK